MGSSLTGEKVAIYIEAFVPVLLLKRCSHVCMSTTVLSSMSNTLRSCFVETLSRIFQFAVIVGCPDSKRFSLS